MKKGLAITLIICAILFIVGGVLIVLGIVNGGAMFFNIDYAHHKVNTSSSKEIISGNEDVDPFTDIEIDVDAAAVTIVKGESYHVDYKLSADAYDKVDIGVESGKLKINAKHKSNYLSLSFNPLPDDLKPYIEITVPENAELKDGTITVDAGNIGVKDLSFDNFTVDSDAGKVTLENATIGSSSLDTDAGDIDITGSDLEKLTILFSVKNLGLLYEYFFIPESDNFNSFPRTRIAPSKVATKLTVPSKHKSHWCILSLSVLAINTSLDEEYSAVSFNVLSS